MSDSADNPPETRPRRGALTGGPSTTYTAGVQAVVYGFPYIYYAQLRHAWVANKRDPEVVPYAAVTTDPVPRSCTVRGGVRQSAEWT
jgi:hypothetical protein